MLREYADSGCNLDTKKTAVILIAILYLLATETVRVVWLPQKSMFNIIHLLDPLPRRDRLCFCNDVDDW